jgi:hypothetical protein
MFGNKIRAINNFHARVQDHSGVKRHNVGRDSYGLWHYMPETPTPSIDQVWHHYWDFKDPQGYVTDAVDAVSYVWAETNSGAGTALVAIDIAGGGARVTNGGADNNFYFYESAQEIVQIVANRDFWFEFEFQTNEATQNDLYVGLCERLGAGNLFDNRVNAIGFRKDDGDTNIDMITCAAGVEAATAVDTLVADTNFRLGLRYDSDPGIIRAYTGQGTDEAVQVGTITTGLPTVLMCVSFGIRNGEADAKTFTARQARVVIEKP